VIAGLLRTISQHQVKLQQELRKPTPNAGLIRKWEKDMARKRMRKSERRLEA
jgi:hypothetical protein